jgi:HEAT repeat protein
LKDFILIFVRRIPMSIIKKFLNMFKSGKGEEEEQAQRLTQKERYDNFLRALTEGDLDTRWNAVRSVGDLGEPFIEPLIQGLKDEYWIIRRGSADTLGKIGAPAVAPLIGSLVRKPSGHSSLSENLRLDP